MYCDLAKVQIMNKSIRWYITTMIPAASVALALCPSASSLLEFNRVAVATGDWWRVLTGHLPHFGLEHLIWDAGVFAVLGIICERRSRTATLSCVGISALLIPAAICLMMPEISTYRGLSGIATALFAMLGMMMFVDSCRQGDHSRTAITALLLTGMVAKIAWEFHSGSAVFVVPSAHSFVAVPLAHLVGAAIGLLVAMGQLLFTNFGLSFLIHGVRTTV